MLRTRFLLLTTAALGCMLVSCGKSDRQLATDIQGKLYADPLTKPGNVNVTVKERVVTLSGYVPSSDVEVEAMKIANGTPGIQSVSDQIKVNPSMAVTQLPDAGSPAPPNASGYPPLSSQPTPASPGAEPPPPPGGQASAPPVQPADITIPAGERVSVRMIDSINSAQNTAGQIFRGALYGPLVSRGHVIVPAGVAVSVLLANARDAGRIKGRSELEVRLSRIEYRGRSYRVESSIYEEQGKARGKQTAVRTGIGAAAGGIIGAIAGRGKGAAIGAAAGGGAGFGTALFTHGQQVRIPSETVLTFRLEAPLTVEL